MSGGIYLIQDDGQLVEMTGQRYDSEALLQELLEKYPNLLAGDQIDSAVPRRWLLVSREMAVPSEQGGAGAGRSIICFSTRMAFPPWSKLSVAMTLAFAAKWLVRCSTMLPMELFTGRLKKSAPSLKPIVQLMASIQSKSLWNVWALRWTKSSSGSR